MSIAQKADPPLRRADRYWTYLIGFIIAVLLLAVTSLLARQHPGMMGWEIPVFNAVNGWPDSLRLLALAVSVTSDSMIIGAVGVVISFFLQLYRLAWRLAVAIFAGYGIIFLAKHFIGRERPAEILSDVYQRAHTASLGFPSGHTMIVTVLALMLIPYVRPRYRWLLAVPIILMGLSRMYLGLHAPLDIIGGFAAGLLVVCFLRILPRAAKVFFRLD